MREKARVCGKTSGFKEVSDWTTNLEELREEYKEFHSGIWSPIWIEQGSNKTRFGPFEEFAVEGK